MHFSLDYLTPEQRAFEVGGTLAWSAFLGSAAFDVEQWMHGRLELALALSTTTTESYSVSPSALARICNGYLAMMPPVRTMDAAMATIPARTSPPTA